MAWFSFKKRATDDDDDVRTTVRKLTIRLTRLEADILDLATAQDIIRNKVLRKIQFKKEEESTDTNKDLYGGMLLPDK